MFRLGLLSLLIIVQLKINILAGKCITASVCKVRNNSSLKPNIYQYQIFFHYFWIKPKIVSVPAGKSKFVMVNGLLLTLKVNSTQHFVHKIFPSPPQILVGNTFIFLLCKSLKTDNDFAIWIKTICVLSIHKVNKLSDNVFSTKVFNL